MPKQFVFTHNNYTAVQLQYYRDLFSRQGNGITYAVFGQEVAPTTGTRHLQGYVVFNDRKRIGAVRSLFTGAHVEVARGTPTQAAEYAKKDGDYAEFGSFDSIPFQGKRSDIDQFKSWLNDQSTYPTDAHIAANFPSLYVRCPRILDLRNLVFPPPKLETGLLNPGWQTTLSDHLEAECHDDRKIIFVVDTVGGEGKTWFCRKYMTDHDDVQVLSIGKRDDLAHAVDITKRVFLFNIPRGQLQYMQFGVLESIKDRIVFSPKYKSTTKMLLHKPHVVVFTNEDPRGLEGFESMLSQDRPYIVDLGEGEETF